MKIHLKFFFFLLSILLLFFVYPKSCLASVGVGVDTGEIVVDDILRPGLSYTLPSINVINTGEQASSYNMSVEIANKEGMLNPKVEWFSFSPEKFFLEGRQSQQVDISLKILSINAQPGDYFVFLVAQPTNNTESVGVAAGTKLYFTIESRNILSNSFYKLRTIFSNYQPWSTIIFILIPLLLVYLYLRSKIQIEKVVKGTNQTSTTSKKNEIQKQKE